MLLGGDVPAGGAVIGHGIEHNKNNQRVEPLTRSPDVYGWLSWDRPAASLTTRCISLSNGRFGHPEQHRAISAREAACLQTFPKTYRFFGSLESRARQIGNAVPPKMAQAIGHSILRQASGS
nr:DNA cytosine methyltransferase [Bradyrhizobium sp. BR 10289]